MTKSRKGGRSWRGNPHGYHPWDDSNLRSVRLPTKLKCGSCKKLRTVDEGHFSSKQMLNMQKHISDHGEDHLLTSGAFFCRLCVPGQRMEIECTLCEKSKPLEDFAKQQRKNADTARCKKCVAKQLTLDPEFENRPDSDDDYEDPDATEFDDMKSQISELTSHLEMSTIAESTDGGVTIPVTIAKAGSGFQYEDDEDDEVQSASASTVTKSTAYENYRPQPFNDKAYGGSSAQSSSGGGGKDKIEDSSWNLVQRSNASSNRNQQSRRSIQDKRKSKWPKPPSRNTATNEFLLEFDSEEEEDSKGGFDKKGGYGEDDDDDSGDEYY